MAAIFTLTTAAATSPLTAYAQGKGLVGAWDITITFRDCITREAQRERPGFISFMFGGVMTDFGTGQPIPQNRTDSHGNWSHENGASYSAVSKAFRFNADGSVAGTVKLFRSIELIDNRAFAANVEAEIYDANGVLIAQSCATEAGTRIE